MKETVMCSNRNNRDKDIQDNSDNRNLFLRWLAVPMSTNMSKEERLTRWMIFCETMINLVSLFSSLNFKKRIIIEEYSRERGKVGRLENLQPNFFLQISTKNQSSTNLSEKRRRGKKIYLSSNFKKANHPIIHEFFKKQGRQKNPSFFLSFKP